MGARRPRTRDAWRECARPAGARGPARPMQLPGDRDIPGWHATPAAEQGDDAAPVLAVAGRPGRPGAGWRDVRLVISGCSRLCRRTRTGRSLRHALRLSSAAVEAADSGETSPYLAVYSSPIRVSRPGR